MTIQFSQLPESTQAFVIERALERLEGRNTSPARATGYKSVRHSAFEQRVPAVLRTIRKEGYKIGLQVALKAGLGAHVEVRKSLARAKSSQ